MKWKKRYSLACWFWSTLYSTVIFNPFHFTFHSIPWLWSVPRNLIADACECYSKIWYPIKEARFHVMPKSISANVVVSLTKNQMQENETIQMKKIYQMNTKWIHWALFSSDSNPVVHIHVGINRLASESLVKHALPTILAGLINEVCNPWHDITK